ncbi:hypothetical protein SpAn4DRAFT_3384 [Sporomusa ovata]|uniref:Uncharacterized protein n=1 Tax=Sporomusa ovata TaxID=2378 RepID=A0A0U1L1Y8_9FIRM|nr:hypothetical protein SpAn4DRAFT_3384 [Sporomusa ovata]
MDSVFGNRAAAAEKIECSAIGTGEIATLALAMTRDVIASNAK